MPRENKRYLLEVHVAGTCFRLDNNRVEVLIAKRHPKKELFPELWECGGGQVNFNENFEEAVIRQMKEELGVNVKNLIPFTVYEIFVPDLEQKKIPGVKFYCFLDSYVNGEGLQIDSNDFTECKWVGVDDLANYDFIPGIVDDIRNAVKLFNLKF